MSFLGWAAGAFVVSRIIKKEKKRQQAKDPTLAASMGNMITANHTKIYRLQQPNIEFRGVLENGD